MKFLIAIVLVALLVLAAILFWMETQVNHGPTIGRSDGTIISK